MKKIKAFGVALDASDSPRSLMIKHAYMEKLAKNKVKLPDYLDPHDAFKALIRLDEIEFVGKVPVETWLTPKPRPEDALLVSPIDFRIFLDSNGAFEYFEKTELFVREKILPDMPLLITPDHSPTGGVLKALSDHHGSDQISTIVFDAHFDAIPSTIRLKLAQYAKENQVETLLPDQKEFIDVSKAEIPASYNCGTFLLHVLQNRIVHPSNLFLVGVSDYPVEQMRNISDERVQNFVNEYLKHERDGVTFLPKSDDQEAMISDFDGLLAKIKTPYVYISFDVDVSAFEAVLATRFLDVFGLKLHVLIEMAKSINKCLASKKFELIGLDFNEIDVHFLQAKLKSGKEDQTVKLIQDFLDVLLK
ncbi:MAG: arginase family protein [Candidatus Helarchaeota archaeon]